MGVGSKATENEAFNTKRLPLPRLECFASREVALEHLGDSVHFWPSRRPKPAKATTAEGKTSDRKLNIQDELQNMRTARGNEVADASLSFGAVDMAKKQVRASLALMRADASARRKQENMSKEEKEISNLQKIKADWNSLRFKRKEKEELVEQLKHQLDSLGGDLEEDVVLLQNLIPEKDELSLHAEEMETELEQETRKGSMYLHMQTRARQTAEEASKKVDLLFEEVASLDRDLESLAMYLRETRRLRAKSEEALNWMQDNYNARSEDKADRLARRREARDEVGRELAETRIALKELKAQWRIEADKKAMEEKARIDKESSLVRQAEQQEVAEEEMRVKLERLAHTVGLKHRPEGSKLRQVEEGIGADDDEGWTPEAIMSALQAVTERRDDCKRQIDKLRDKEIRLWRSLPEWRTRLQAERQGWSDMWQRRLTDGPEDTPKEKKKFAKLKPPGPSTNTLTEEVYQTQMAERKKELALAMKEESLEQEKLEESARLLASVMTGLTGMERVITESAPSVESIPGETGSVIPGISSEDAMAAKAKMLFQTTSTREQRLSISEPPGRRPPSQGADEKALTVPRAVKDDEVTPYIHLGETLHRVLDHLRGICDKAEVDLKAKPEGALRDVRPVGVKLLKVHQPLGIIDEIEIPGKYTTKEGFAVAGPHVNAEDDDDLEDEKFLKSKIKYSSGGGGNEGSTTPGRAKTARNSNA
mmetsp:Transcript_7253/g.14745  ORF Transcript_7253/g.14745 Transcript_7253/m.14745 type:complete len:709 (-) Transcript_7253:331-2457(-)